MDARLDDLIGQARAVTVLERALATSRVPHAYLFEGPPGVGKRTAAVGMAMALNCEGTAERRTGGACGSCDSCRRISGGLHPDVVTYAPDGTQILMEQAQEIVALGQRRPHEARARVIIVDEADRLNPNASNCLLKTLEEPSPGNHLVLVTPAPDRLLATIRSRTQRIRFRSLSPEELMHLGRRRGLEGDPGDIQIAALVAGGCVTRFLAMATDTEDHGTRDATAALLRAAEGRGTSGGIASLLDVAVSLGDKESKQRLPDVLALLGRVYRDALVRAIGAAELAVLEEPGEQEGGAVERAEGSRTTLNGTGALTVPGLGRALQAVVEAETALGGNVNAVMAIERLLLTLRREGAAEGVKVRA